LVHLNDGKFTRIAAPPRRSSAIDFNLCIAGLALGDFEWTVLEYADGSDHLLILTFFKSLNVPTNLPILIFDLSRHISWSVYVDTMLDSLDIAAREDTDVEKRYETFFGTRTKGRHRTAHLLQAVW
jgi:hypothetical protein